LHPLLRFGLLATGLYLLWFLGYEQYLALDGRWDAALTENIATASVALLRLLGFPAAVAPTQSTLVLVNGMPTVSIWTACNGMVLYALFAGFVVAFPGPLRHKLWFIPLGIALIYGLNVLRIALLCLNHLYYHHTVDFNHHYTFTFIVYGCIFLLWMGWATRLAPPTLSPIASSHA
jgi:exosortase family protein XrtF